MFATKFKNINKIFNIKRIINENNLTQPSVFLPKIEYVDLPLKFSLRNRYLLMCHKYSRSVPKKSEFGTPVQK